MGMSGATMVRIGGALALTGAVVGAVACQAPTQMRMVLRTDMACDTSSGAAYSLNDVSIYVAADHATLQQHMRDGLPAAYMSACVRGAGGELGTLYLTPEGSDVGIVAVMAGLVHSGVGTTTRQSAQTCTSATQENCLLSIRRFRYSTHRTGVIPVLLEASCVNHRPECAPGETCRSGVCATDVIDDPMTSNDPPMPGPDAGSPPIPDAAPSVDAGPVVDGSTVVPSVLRCEGGAVQWTPDPPADASCTLPTNTIRCVQAGKDGRPMAVCVPPGNPCPQPCCGLPMIANRQCCITNGVPLIRVGTSCGADVPACFDANDCKACGAAYDPALGFGGCKG